MAKHGPDEGWHQHVLNTVIPKMEAAAATAPTITGLTPGPVNPQPVINVGFQSLQPDFDVIDGLPETRKDLLRKLRLRSDDQHAIIPEFETIREASLAKIAAQNELRRLTDHPQDGGFNLLDDNRSVIAAKRTLAKTTDDLTRLQELQEVRTAAWQAASRAKAVCEDFLRHGLPGNCQIAETEIEPPKLAKGETVIDAIERLRRRCRELKADAHRISSSPFPSVYCKAQMRGQIEALAMQGAPSVSALIELDGKIEFQTLRVQSEVYAEQRALAFAQVPDTLALTCWLHRDALIAALDREISTEADDAAALSHELRQQREAETMADLLAVERIEAELVWQAQAQGLPLEFRGDISPLAILQVQLITVPRAAPPTTTSGHSFDILRPDGR